MGNLFAKQFFGILILSSSLVHAQNEDLGAQASSAKECFVTARCLEVIEPCAASSSKKKVYYSDVQPCRPMYTCLYPSPGYFFETHWRASITYRINRLNTCTTSGGKVEVWEQGDVKSSGGGAAKGKGGSGKALQSCQTGLAKLLKAYPACAGNGVLD